MNHLALLFTLFVSGSLLCRGAEAPGAQTTGKPENTASEAAKDTNAAPAFKLSIHSANPPGITLGVPGTDVLLKVSEQKPALGFYVPTGWHLRSANTNNSLFAISREPLLGDITVGIELDPDKIANPFNADTVRPLVLERLKGAHITEEGGTGALGVDGLAFDLAQSMGGDLWNLRTIVLPTSLGQLQITMRAPRDKVAEVRSTMLRIIATLRLVSKEEQEHPPAPPKSLAL